MNQDEVKEQLLKLNQDVTDFTLTFSGKKSKKINGLYHPSTKTIIIHNRNFKSDNLLMYTAIHEFAHHVQQCKTGSTRHNKEFWYIFHNLLDLSIHKGIWVEGNDESVNSVVEQIRLIMAEVADRESVLGELFKILKNICVESDERFEDRVQRDLGIKLSSARKFELISHKGLESISSPDIRSYASRVADNKIDSIKESLEENKSFYQITSEPLIEKSSIDDKEDLLKERERISRTISSLTRRLQAIEEALQE